MTSPKPPAAQTLPDFPADAPAAPLANAPQAGAPQAPPSQASASVAAVAPLAEIAALLPPRGSLLGLDLGTKTIGVATCDPDRRLATIVETIQRTKFTADATRLLALADERKAVAFVLGLPLNMDGSEGPRVQASRAFARNFARLSGRPIAFWDERLSTVAVERALISADMSRAKRANVIDQHAAAFILQGALDFLNRRSFGNER